MNKSKKPDPMTNEIISNIKKFRDEIHPTFDARNDAAMNLLDALSSNTSAKSAMDLSLNPLFQRNYCSLTRVVSEFYSGLSSIQEKNNDFTRIISRYCPPLKTRQFHLFGADCTPNPRPFSPTQEDRGFIYVANRLRSNKPIDIGHKYSVTAYLPEKDKDSPPWIIPLACARVSTSEKGTMVGLNQINYCLSQESFKDQLCVSVLDSEYSSHECLTEIKKNKNHVGIMRLKSNRTVYLPPDPVAPNEPKKGPPKKFGRKLKLQDFKDEASSKKTAPEADSEPKLETEIPLTPEPWPEPSDKKTISSFNKRGEEIKIKILSWDDILMRDKRGSDLSDTPMRLIRVAHSKKDSEEELFEKPIWLIVYGKRCQELSLEDIFYSYKQRFDLEHFYRFGKNRLLMDRFQTPDCQHEEAWWQLVILSYVQLYLARGLASYIFKPWEKYAAKDAKSEPIMSPTQVQRSFTAISTRIGTPAKNSKGHRKAWGRKKGELQTKRPRHPVVKKEKKPQPSVLQV